MASTKPQDAEKPAKATKKASPTPTKGSATKTAQGRSQAATRTSQKTSQPTTDVPATGSALGAMNFRPGSEAAQVFEEILKGGGSRREVQARVAEKFSGQQTAKGNPKPVVTVVNQLIRRALKTGRYKVVQSWRLVPIEEGETATAPAAEATKASEKASTKASAKKTASRKAAVGQTKATKAENASDTRKSGRKSSK